MGCSASAAEARENTHTVTDNEATPGKDLPTPELHPSSAPVSPCTSWQEH